MEWTFLVSKMPVLCIVFMHLMDFATLGTKNLETIDCQQMLTLKPTFGIIF